MQHGYGEQYYKANGFRYFEGYFLNDKHNGLCKKYYDTQPHHQNLWHIGYKIDNKWHGRLNFYSENGKFSSRVFNQNNKYVENFRVFYDKTGGIDLEKSYKGEDYSFEDFRREYM